MPVILWGDITLFTATESYATYYVEKSPSEQRIYRGLREINKNGVTNAYAHISLGLSHLRESFVHPWRREFLSVDGLILWGDILPYMSETLMIEKIVSIIILLYKYIHI